MKVGWKSIDDSTVVFKEAQGELDAQAAAQATAQASEGAFIHSAAPHAGELELRAADGWAEHDYKAIDLMREALRRHNISEAISGQLLTISVAAATEAQGELGAKQFAAQLSPAGGDGTVEQ